MLISLQSNLIRNYLYFVFNEISAELLRSVTE